MVVTMLEASVAPEREPELKAAYRDGVGGGFPDWLLETMLLRQDGTTTWRIVTLWRSREELDAYRGSGETPTGVLVFRAAGAEPALKIFEVAERRTA